MAVCVLKTTCPTERGSIGASSWASAKSLVRLCLAISIVAAASVSAQQSDEPLPSFAQLQVAGARIGQIRVVTGDIFDTTDPKEANFLFGLANTLHIKTRPDVIERALLFKAGDLLSVRVLEETERILRSNSYIYDVKYRVLNYRDGIVDIEVATRDTWTLGPGINAARSGGANASGFSVSEGNLLGTGIALSVARSNGVDRSSNAFQFSSPRAFGTWTALNLSHAVNSDGRLDSITVLRPFYALDARWSAGVAVSRDERIESIYNAGNIASQYRHRQELAEVFGGWSAGLIDGWAQRYSLGLSLQDDRFAIDSGLVAPPKLPADKRFVGPFFRFELLEDRFDRQLNRNLIGRPEFFALGLAAKMQLGWASAALGSSQDALLYSGSVSRGFEPAPDSTLITAALISGQYVAGQVQRQRVGAQAQYYLPQGHRWLFYGSAAGDVLTRPEAIDELLLGGDNGLRGYPLRYQSGHKRLLFTVEERFYTDLYVWQLFRVGGAGFVDVGRAWDGTNPNTISPGWLSNVGIGLRIVSSRSSSGNVLHVDLAVPLRAPAEIKKVQLLIRTKFSF